MYPLHSQINPAPLALLAVLFPQAIVYAASRRVLVLPNLSDITPHNVQAAAIFRDLENLLDEAENIQARADSEDRDLTAAENSQIDGISARFGAASARLDSHRSTGRRAEPNDPNDPGNPYSRGGLDDRNRAELPAALPRMQSPISGIRGRRLADVFGSRAASLDGWRSSDEFLRTLALGLSHSNLRAAANVEGVGEDGGFLVPAQLLADILDGSLEQEICRPRARFYGMMSNSLHVAGIDRRDHTNNVGGLAGVWMGENDTATPQKLKLRAVELRAGKLGIFTQASNELVQDGLNFETQLTGAMSEVASFDLDYAFLLGDGVAKPLGALVSPSRIVVAKESGQVADTIVLSNILKMFARLHPALTKNAVWVCSPECIPQLVTLVLTTGGVSVPVFLPAGAAPGSVSMASAPSPTLLGLPVLLSEKVPSLGDEGDISLIAFSEYAVGLRLDATLQRNNAPGWYSDLSDWRLILRVAGGPLWAAPVTPKNGGPTLGWCITLATRA